MPSEETRRLLKTLGIAVTDYEDAVQNRSSIDEIERCEAHARACLEDVRLLIDRLRSSTSSPGA